MSHAVTYTIYTITPAPSADRGAAWARYGVLQSRDDAIQIAKDLFGSDEFARVEVHETRLASFGTRQRSHLYKAYIRRDSPYFLRVGAVAAALCIVCASTLFIL